jgi:membrane-bound ClpP family serine protease
LLLLPQAASATTANTIIAMSAAIFFMARG